MVSRSKILCVVSQEAIQVVSFQQSSDVHKKCKIQVSTIYPNATLCIKICTPFIEIDDKGGEIVQRYKSLEIKIVQGGEIRYESFGRGLRQRSRGWTWTWTKREQR